MTTAEPEDVRNLRALKGPALSIMLAMFITEATVVRGGYLVSATAYSQDRIETGAQALAAMGFVEKVGRYDWRLTANGRQLPLARALLDGITRLQAPATPQNAESAGQPAGKSNPQKAVSDSQKPLFQDQDPLEKPAIPATPQKAESDVPLTTTTDTYLNAIGTSSRQLFQALTTAGVYANAIPKLSARLLADASTDWLRQVLGWIAYSVAQGSAGPRDRGAAICLALNDLQQVPDDAYLPPAGLPFDQAQAWAKRGGPQPEPEPEFEPIIIDQPTLAPIDDLWQRGLARLAMEMPRQTIDLLAMCALHDGIDPDSYVLVCNKQGSADWIRTRLNGRLVPALSEAAGKAVTISVQYIEEP